MASDLNFLKKWVSFLVYFLLLLFPEGRWGSQWKNGGN